MSRLTPDNQRRRYGSVVVALLAGIIWGLMQYFTPVMTDDLAFMAQYLACNNGNPSFSPQALLDFALYNRAHDNFRLANTLAPFSTLFSPWKELFPLLTGIAGGSLVWLTARLGRDDWPGWKFQSAVWLFITLVLPMRAGLFIRDYSLNYIYASALTLFAAFYIIKCEKSHWPGASLAAGLLIAVLAAGWHESPPFAVSAGMVAYIIISAVRRRNVSWQWGLVTATLIFATLIFLLCPGMLQRAVREVGGDNDIPLPYRVYDSLTAIAFAATLIIATVAKPLRGRLIQLLSNPAFVVFGCSAIAGIVLATIIIPNQRASVWPQLSAIIALCLFWQPWRWRITLSAKRLAASGALALCLLHGGHAIAWQHRFHTENKLIMRLYAISRHGTVFTDKVTMVDDVPPTTLSYPSKLLWVNQLHYHQFRFLNPGKPLAVVPSSLRIATTANSRPLLPDSTLFVTPRGDLFAALHSPAPTDIAGAHLIYRDNNGESSALWCFANSYVNDLGDTLVYIRPFGRHSIDLETIRAIVVYPYRDPFRGDPRSFRQNLLSEIKHH